MFLLLLSVSLPLVVSSPVGAQERLNQNGNSPGFWLPAEQLVQQQLNLINRIQRSLSSPDINLTEGTRGQLFLHLGRVERFLLSQYPTPELLCTNGSVAANVPADLSLPQREVYCALYAGMQELKPIVSVLDRRLPMLAGIAAPNPIPPNPPQAVGLGLNLLNPIQPGFGPVPDFPQPEPPVIGVPAKTPIVDYQEPPLPPAIAPPKPASRALLSAREQLVTILPAFPASARIIDPGPNPEIIANATYGLLPLEPQQYAEFLAQPDTGIARILLAQSYSPDPNQLRNRLQPTVLEQFPFAPLAENPTGLTPRLALDITQGNFHILMPGLDYGFIVNLGAVPLEDIDPNLKNISALSPAQQDLFLNYNPPNQLEALQVDQRRFLTGKDGVGFVPPVSPPASTEAPVILKNTYLVRLIQFQIPEVLLTGKPISRSQRRHLPDILKTPSSDVIVAFQPVHRRLDGSYTVLWRLVYQFPNPQIEDLDQYVELE